MTKTDELMGLAQTIATEKQTFFEVRGPGAGNRETTAFMADLRRQAEDGLGTDYTERRISGNSKLAVDFYIPEEATIVEIALGLKHPKSEFERDILKAVMAKEQEYPVERLVFVSKPGGTRRVSQAGAKAIISWLKRHHDIGVEVRELQDD